MLRRLACVVALSLLVADTPRADACGPGSKCIEKPAPIYEEGPIDVHANGNWHENGTGGGHLSAAAMERFNAFRTSGASKSKVSRCLSALTRNEKSRAAKRACKVKKKSASR
jgi:hypothetical protein